MLGTLCDGATFKGFAVYCSSSLKKCQQGMSWQLNPWYKMSKVLRSHCIHLRGRSWRSTPGITSISWTWTSWSWEWLDSFRTVPFHLPVAFLLSILPSHSISLEESDPTIKGEGLQPKNQCLFLPVFCLPKLITAPLAEQCHAAFLHGGFSAERSAALWGLQDEHPRLYALNCSLEEPISPLTLRATEEMVLFSHQGHIYVPQHRLCESADSEICLK